MRNSSVRKDHDLELLFTGSQELPAEFWEEHGKDIHSWQREGKDTNDWYPNQFIYLEDNFDAIVHDQTENSCVIEPGLFAWAILAR